MGLITLLIAIAFTVLYFGRSLEKKPEQLVRVTGIMMTHIDKIARWGGAYGITATVLTLVIGYSAGDMLIRLVNNLMICMMALPFIFDKLTEKYHGKVNAAIMEEARNLVGWVSRNEKYLSYAGATCAAVLFFMLFK
jgi:hypothetical protein